MLNYQKLHKRKTNFEANLIKLISLLLVILFLSVLVLYYSSMKSMYSEQLEKSNESIVSQVAISFETIMSQITDGIYKIPMYDDELIRLIDNSSKDMLYQIQLQRKLNNVVLGNNYIYSSYLYIANQDIVYSSEKNNSYSLSAFPDIKAIVANSNGTISILDPRVVDSLEGRRLLLSVVCPIPLYQGEYKALLVVNIDANKLYYDVLKNIKTDANMNIYVYNNENTIVINKDALLIDTKYTPKAVKAKSNVLSKAIDFLSQRKVIASMYHSQKLNWNFALETSIDSTYTYLTKLYSIGLSFIFLMLLGLMVSVWIIKFSTKPMKKALSSYNEKLWIDFLTDNDVDSDLLYKQLQLDEQPHNSAAYAIFILNIIRHDIDQKTYNQYVSGIKAFTESMKNKFDTNIIVIHKNYIAILVNSQQKYENDEKELQFANYAKLIYSQLNDELRSFAFMSVSTVKSSALELPAAYKECVEALNYKIAYGDSHFLLYSGIKGAKQELPYEYPNELEKQLNNNLTVGNTEACELFLDKFFNKLAEPQYHLSDSEIKNYIYQLQTSILKTVGSLPMPLKIDSSINILNEFDLRDIKVNVSAFIANLAAEINKSDEDEQVHLIKYIFEFIDKKLSHEDFNLNIAADSLNLNRNYLAKIIKEKTGYSFNEYVNKKRIALAKTLLQDKSMPIEAIAHEVGFNYSHYFIKVFKSIEGITPGQYRDTL